MGWHTFSIWGLTQRQYIEEEKQKRKNKWNESQKQQQCHEQISFKSSNTRSGILPRLPHLFGFSPSNTHKFFQENVTATYQFHCYHLRQTEFCNWFLLADCCSVMSLSCTEFTMHTSWRKNRMTREKTTTKNSTKLTWNKKKKNKSAPSNSNYMSLKSFDALE